MFFAGLMPFSAKIFRDQARSAMVFILATVRNKIWNGIYRANSGEGDSGLVFDGGDPHQGRSVGFYPAVKNE